MVQKTSPFVEAKYGWDFGESGWNSGMDENLLRFSYLFDGNIDGSVGTLPVPTNGQAYYLTTDKRLYFSVSNVWYSTSTPLWKTLKERSTGNFYQYDGTNLVQVDNYDQTTDKFFNLQISVDDLESSVAELQNNSIGYVDSISQLLSVDYNVVNKVKVKGYHSGTSIGGGKVRYWDSSRPKADHNGGNIIDPSKSFPSDWNDLTTVQGWFTPNPSGVGCWVSEDNSSVYILTEFGLSPTVNNNQPAYYRCCESAGPGATIIFPATPFSYRMHWFFGFDSQKVVAYGAKIDLFKLTPGPTVLAVSGNNARYEGVWLNCTETNLPNVRTSFEDRSNSVWVDCRFEGFRDASPLETNNGWGTYFKRSQNISLKNCQFENNSQNDIAILEGSSNISIDGAFGGALNINFEPNNGLSPIKCVTISNSKISKLSIQENDGDNESVNAVVVVGCDIDTCNYDGAGVEFISSTIGTLATWYDALGRAAAGNLRLNGAIALGSNLLRDPGLVSTSYNLAGSSWSVNTNTIPVASLYSRVTTSLGRAYIMNPSNLSGTNSQRSGVFPATAGTTYVLMALMGAFRPASGSTLPLTIAVQWLDAASADLGTVTCLMGRGAIGSNIPDALRSAVVQAPPLTAQARVIIGSTVASASTTSTRWYSVGLHPVISGGRGSNMPDPYVEHSATRGFLTGVGVTPTAASNVNYEVGDKIEFLSPVAGGFKGSICTVAGTPGTWQGYGRIDLSGFATYDPPSLVDGAGATTTVTVTGAALGDYVSGVSFSLDLQGITLTAWVSAANTVSVRFQNESGGVLDLGSGTLRVKVDKK